MASHSATGTVVLLPIHPEHAEAILRGAKTVEFRRRAFARRVTHVVVYSTKPVARVTGVFRVARVDEAAPIRLWAEYHSLGGISESSFFRYYEGTNRGVAITVAQAWRLSEPVALNELDERLCVPQSYAYLPPEHLATLLAKAVPV